MVIWYIVSRFGMLRQGKIWRGLLQFFVIVFLTIINKKCYPASSTKNVSAHSAALCPHSTTRDFRWTATSSSGPEVFKLKRPDSFRTTRNKRFQKLQLLPGQENNWPANELSLARNWANAEDPRRSADFRSNELLFYGQFNESPFHHPRFELSQKNKISSWRSTNQTVSSV
jgi:hypothetical protein